MRRHVRLGWLTMAAVLAAGSCKDDVGPTEVHNFTANLTKSIFNPDTNSTTATGTATLSAVGGVLLYRIDVVGISNVSFAHIHGPAAPGASAGVILNLCGTGAPAPACVSGTGVLASGIATPIATVTSLKSHLEELPDKERFDQLAPGFRQSFESFREFPGAVPGAGTDKAA